ncbi:MAG: flagellar hook-associated protein FlgK [Bradymonadia bacterium]
MTSLIGTLMSSASGMRAGQSGLATVSHNIANADTEGYSRQSVRLAASAPTKVMGKGQGGLLGQGSHVDTVDRAQARFMEAQVMRDRMNYGYFRGRMAPLENFELTFDNGTDSTISDRMQQFFDAVTELSQDPASASARNGFLEASQQAARSFRTVSLDVQAGREQVDQVIEDRLNKVNSLSKRISELNVQVASTRKTGGNASDYEDRREQAMRELGELVDIRFSYRPNGAVGVETAGGFPLVRDDQSAMLSGVPNAANDGLIDVVHTSFNGQATVINEALSEGEVTGLLRSRDDIMGARRNELDQLAFEFASEVNAVHRQGFGLDGVDGRDLFVQPLVAADAAQNLEVEAAIEADTDLIGAAQDPTLLPGDNRNLFVLADLQNQRSVNLGNQSYNAFFSEMVRGIGNEVQQNTFDAEFAEIRLAQSDAMRDSIEGVNVDDELVDLTRFQKHFQANTRVLDTANRLMDEIMRMIG